jgi:hypothetical protein
MVAAIPWAAYVRHQTHNPPCKIPHIYTVCVLQGWASSEYTCTCGISSSAGSTLCTKPMSCRPPQTDEQYERCHLLPPTVRSAPLNKANVLERRHLSGAHLGVRRTVYCAAVNPL